MNKSSLFKGFFLTNIRYLIYPFSRVLSTGKPHKAAKLSSVNCSIHFSTIKFIFHTKLASLLAFLHLFPFHLPLSPAPWRMH